MIYPTEPTFATAADFTDASCSCGYLKWRALDIPQLGRCRVRLAIRVVVSSTRTGARGRRSCQESAATSSAGSTPATEQRGKPQGNNIRGFLIVSAYLMHESNDNGVNACLKLPWTADAFISIRCCFNCFQEKHIRFVLKGLGCSCNRTTFDLFVAVFPANPQVGNTPGPRQRDSR